jgi:predicted ATP-grasp superfamily ATP-dependent carboligase
MSPTAFVLTHESDPQRTDKSLSIIALTITRSLGRHGVPVVRVHPNRLEHGLSSRYCRAVEVCPDPSTSERALVDFLLGLHGYDAPRVLFPASDDCAEFVARHQDALRAVYELPVAPREVVEGIIDKRRQYATAERLGLPIPQTSFADPGDDGRRLAERVHHYPCIMKPVVAHRWRRREAHAATGGRKAIFVGSREELITGYDRIRRFDPLVMVQEVIPGGDERLVTFLSYFDAVARPVGYCIRKKIRQYPVDFGHCMITESCFDEVVREQSIRLLSGLGYHGLSGVEWKLDPRTGRYLLIEINARAVQTIGLAAACGVDLPWVAFLDKLGQRVDLPQDFEEGVKWLWLTGDLRALRDLRRMGALTLRDWLRSLRGKKVHAVWAVDDPRPLASFTYGALQAAWRSRRSSRNHARNRIRPSTQGADLA